jgi:release factor glutamine methyltransferase
MTIAEAQNRCFETLLALYDPAEAGHISKILLEHITGFRLQKSNQILKGTQLEEFNHLLQRLQSGEPIQYVTGRTWFYGLELKTDPRALIPRPETEELVHVILEKNPAKKPLRVLDIGTGTGCIAIALKSKRPSWEVWALDKSKDALALCMENALSLQIPIHAVQADILDESEWGKLGQFDIIISNPPYICPSEKVHMSAQVLDFEPHAALFVPEADPFLFYKAIARFAAHFLTKGGKVYFEINEFRAEALGDTLLLDFNRVELIPDLQGKMRMIEAENSVN